MELSRREYAADVLANAKHFLQRNSALKPPRPFIIEFTGPPLSGKTTLIDGLDNYLRHEKFSVQRPQEGAEVFRHISRETPHYNLTTAAYALRNVMEAVYSSDHDFVLLDRGLYDAHPWMEYWKSKKKLSEHDALRFQLFFTHPLMVSEIDLCFFVFCSPEEAGRRKQKSSPELYGDAGGSYTSPESLRKLSEIFSRSCDILQADLKPVARIDTTDLQKPAMYDAAIEKLLPSIAARSFSQKTQFTP